MFHGAQQREPLHCDQAILLRRFKVAGYLHEIRIGALEQSAAVRQELTAVNARMFQLSHYPFLRPRDGRCDTPLSTSHSYAGETNHEI